jgi:DNA-binding ferritin-like protein
MMTDLEFAFFEETLKKYIQTIFLLETDKTFSDYRAYRKRLVEDYEPLVQHLKEILVTKE